MGVDLDATVVVTVGAGVMAALRHEIIAVADEQKEVG